MRAVKIDELPAYVLTRLAGKLPTCVRPTSTNPADEDAAGNLPMCGERAAYVAVTDTGDVTGVTWCAGCVDRDRARDQSDRYGRPGWHPLDVDDVEAFVADLAADDQVDVEPAPVEVPAARDVHHRNTRTLAAALRAIAARLDAVAPVDLTAVRLGLDLQAVQRHPLAGRTRAVVDLAALLDLPTPAVSEGGSGQFSTSGSADHVEISVYTAGAAQLDPADGAACAYPDWCCPATTVTLDPADPVVDLAVTARERDTARRQRDGLIEQLDAALDQRDTAAHHAEGLRMALAAILDAPADPRSTGLALIGRCGPGEHYTGAALRAHADGFYGKAIRLAARGILARHGAGDQGETLGDVAADLLDDVCSPCSTPGKCQNADTCALTPATDSPAPATLTAGSDTARV